MITPPTMANKIDLSQGGFGDYEPSDSDQEYTERERVLLKRVRKGKKKSSDSEEEALAFDDDEDNSDFEDQTAADKYASDFEDDDEDDGIPSAKAWGNKRNAYYSTDFVDQDYSSYTAKEEEQARQEEDEARAIQQRLAKQLEEFDFSLDNFSSGKVTKASGGADDEDVQIKADLSDLSKRQKLQLFKKDSPEFEGLASDFSARIAESKDVLEPALAYFAENDLQKLPLCKFVQTMNKLVLNYCTNIGFYLVLKANRTSIKNHPIIKRLVQMKTLLLQLDEKYAEVVKPQLEKLLDKIESGEHFKVAVEQKQTKSKKTKKLNILKKMERKARENGDIVDDDINLNGMMSSDEDEDLSPPLKQMKLSKDISSDDNTDEEEEKMQDNAEEVNSNNELEDEDDDERRGITYQMAKNKGLTPYRKKELRNPRVKHRNKFRKANIRRKGAVRTVRKELKRYDGEYSGIKAGVKKGIKIK